ncbi:MAG TPA: isoprenylcysteine carboxylmethyltransferase family protein [Candidatus Saccharimonadales bacterium]|nr:isoprenylcysteine carboxylmethyltransferase family protein [Candidatus Saccharimonadales bacterium]
MKKPNTANRSAQPSLIAHAGALLMPCTTVVFVPAWLLWSYPVKGVGVWTLAGAGLFAAACALFVVTFRLFVTVGKGTLAPWNPTRKLIIAGPYRYCRNPMISGVLGMIVGEAIGFGSYALGVWAIIFFTVNTCYFAWQEEPNLRRTFGASYEAYRRKVPRWLPRFSAYKG